MLPKDFLQRMEQMLGEEYPAFLESYDNEKYKALRVNAGKGTVEQKNADIPCARSPVPWAEHGFYYGGEDTPGKHPYHEAGVYYIQEPSAMAPVSYLMGNYDLTQNPSIVQERILDLCAAPGGKSTQIAAAMKEAYVSGRWQSPGFLLCNEIHPARAKILSENIERMGISNAVVTNETPQSLAAQFDSYFTRILVDAPCSGEGMFRKNEDACGEWSLENVALCAGRQDEILDCAASMLAPGGRMVYSTCTFAPAENEGSIARFLLRHPEFSIVEQQKVPGMEPGRPQWAFWDEKKDVSPEKEEKRAQILPSLAHTIRLWPHKLHGEGHYLAVLQKDGRLCSGGGYYKGGEEKGISEKDSRTPGKGLMEFFAFAKETLNEAYIRSIKDGTFVKFGDQLYLAPEQMPSLNGLKVLRPGLHLGTIKKNRFEPSHALALALTPKQVLRSAELPSAEPEIKNYLNGGTFSFEGEKGWYLITTDRYSIGWGKLAGGVMKNHYPKGLRKLL